MIWIFKTSIQTDDQVETVTPLLDKAVLPNGRWNFDLQDCDHVLRIENPAIEIPQLINLFSEAGFHCEELAD
jgi:hypothetical protein